MSGCERLGQRAGVRVVGLMARVKQLGLGVWAVVVRGKVGAVLFPLRQLASMLLYSLQSNTHTGPGCGLPPHVINDVRQAVTFVDLGLRRHGFWPAMLATCGRWVGLQSLH